MNTSYISGSYVVNGVDDNGNPIKLIEGGERYLTSNLFFVQLNSEQIKTLIAAPNKEVTLQELFTNNAWQVRNSNTSFICEKMAFIVAYYADLDGNILKVASNYASIDANGESPTRSIIYMQELMFTANTEVDLSDTTLKKSDFNTDTMLTDAYDFNNGISLGTDSHTLKFIVFDGVTFKQIADLVMYELKTWTAALNEKLALGTVLIGSTSIDISSGVYYVIPFYSYNSPTVNYFGANFMRFVNGESFTVETLSNDIAFTITSIESEVVGSNIELKFNRDYLNDVYFDYELNALNQSRMEIIALSVDEFNTLTDYYKELRLDATSSIIVNYGPDKLKLKNFTLEQTLEFILYYYRIEQKVINGTNADDIQAAQTILDFLKMAMFEVIPDNSTKEGEFFILTGEMFDEALKSATVNKIATSDIYSIPINEPLGSAGMYIGAKFNINTKNIEKISMNYVYYKHGANSNSIDTTIYKTYAEFMG